MAKAAPKGNTAIQRLLDERRQYEAFIVRLDAAADATSEGVRARVRADYEARLRAVTDELKAHADSARQMIEQKQLLRAELEQQETRAAERLAETELRHAVGEYDEAQWRQVHAEALAELVSVRERLQTLEADVAQLEEVAKLARAPREAAPLAVSGPRSKVGPPPKPQPKAEEREQREEKKVSALDELAFLKSVTEDDKGTAPSPRRASGAQFQPAQPDPNPRATAPAPPRPPSPASRPSSISAQPTEPEPERLSDRTLKCRECGTMNLPTEWYCEQCGAELAAV